MAASCRAPSRALSAIERIREKLGSGSPNTINPLLDAWWKRLGARLDAGPAALHRLPESVAHVAEALWMQALAEGRRRAAQEQNALEFRHQRRILMEPLHEALRLIKRQAELENAMRRPGGIRITEERELFQLRNACLAHVASGSQATSI